MLRLVMQAAGPGRRYEGLDDSGVVVAAGRLAALESWITSQKLAAIRAIIRRRPAPGHEPEIAGGLPGLWCKDLSEELACELAITRGAADDLIELAWVLEARLPLTAAALDDGILDLSKVRMIAAETSILSDEDASEAEKLVAPKWARKTWGQLRRLVVLAVVNIDPDGAVKRREQAERDDARVRLWREHAGTAGLAGYGLQTERALTANAILQARAIDYRSWGIPGTLDQLRALAYLDLLTGRDSRTQYPRETGTGPATGTTPDSAASDSAGPDSASLSGASPSGADPDSTGPSGAGPDSTRTSRGSGDRYGTRRGPGSVGRDSSANRPADNDRDDAASSRTAPAPGDCDDAPGDDQTWAEPRDDAWDDEAWGDDVWDDGTGYGGTLDDYSGDDENWDDRNWNDELGGDESGEGGPDGSDSGPGGGPDGDGNGGPSSGGNGGADGNGGPGGGVVPDNGLPANVDLTIPLPCLTEHAQRAGEAHGLGVLDPDLARKLAAEAAKHPRSVFRVIVTDPDGHAIGFGQANRIRKRRPGADEPPRDEPPRDEPPRDEPPRDKPPRDKPPSTGQDNRDGIRDGTAMPATTFTPANDRQPTLFPDHRAGSPDAALSPEPGTGWAAATGGGRDTWILRIVDQAFSVTLLPIPNGECDHRYESRGYQPSDTLRRLVQIRDGECTMPICVRHPRGCDWEHAVPWPAGRTCSCNGGSRCRHDHLIKQSPRWDVEQLPGGLHRWTTPSGLMYAKGPKQHPT